MNRLLAIGDIHGCLDELRSMIEEEIRATKDDRIVLLGDYVDRGYKIRETIDYIISLEEQGYDIVTLRGNHEVMMLNAFKTGNYQVWLQNGAESTLRSFGIGINEKPDEKYLAFFEGLLWYYQYENYLFVHAGFSDTDPFGDKHEMVWTRNEKYTNSLLADKVIVHGHTPISTERCIANVKSGKHVINIDTGCVYNDPDLGTLTAVDLFTRELFFVA